MEQFQQSLQDLDSKLLEVNRNLTKIFQYICRVMAPLNSSDLSLYKEWDTRSMVGYFAQLNQHALVSSNDTPGTSRSRLHFAIRCAKGGLAANAKIFLDLAQELTAAFGTCRTLRAEFRTAAETDKVLKNKLQEVSDYMKRMGANFMKIKEVIYENFDLRAPLEASLVVLHPTNSLEG